MKGKYNIHPNSLKNLNSKAATGLIPWNKGEMTILKCNYCKSDFKVHPCRKNTARYCSRSCSASIIRKVPVFKKCATCSSDFKIHSSSKSSSRGSKRIFCSKKCYGVNLSKKGGNTTPPKMVTSKYRLWLENGIQYRSIHLWMRRNFGTPTTCEECGEEKTGHFMHWSNVSGEYKKDREDWRRLCAKCHKRADLVNLTPILA